MPNGGLVTDELLLQSNTLYLSGPFGAGKTTAAIERIQRLLRQERVRGDQILVLVPQRTLGQPYQEALRRSDIPAGALVQVTTVASLARSSVALYWPLVARSAGFAEPRKEPTFLNLETTQYHMERFVNAAVQQAEFDPVRLQRGRIVSQVLDNLNKAALHDFTIDEAYARLENTVPPGEQMTARLNVLRTGPTHQSGVPSIVPAGVVGRLQSADADFFCKTFSKTNGAGPTCSAPTAT